MKRKKREFGIVSVMYIRMDGKLFLQLKSSNRYHKYYTDFFDEFDNGHVLIDYHGCLIGGRIVHYTSTGVILDDWRIDRK